MLPSMPSVRLISLILSMIVPNSYAEARSALRASRVYAENRSDDIHSFVIRRGDGLFVITSISSGENTHTFKISARNGENYILRLSQSDFHAYGPDNSPLKITFRDDPDGKSASWKKMNIIEPKETVVAYFEVERWDRSVSGSGIYIVVDIRGGPTPFWFNRDRE